jgi:hypothetical protein
MKKEKVNGNDLDHSFFLPNINTKTKIAATGATTEGNSDTDAAYGSIALISVFAASHRREKPMIPTS